MSARTYFLSFVVITFPLILTTSLSAALKNSEFENTPILKSTDLIDLNNYANPSYSIQNTVKTDGFLATFVIDSAFGQFTAKGPGMLSIRLQEVIAIERLTKVSEEEEFIKGARVKALEKGSSLISFFENPENSIKNIPAGVGRFFSRTSRKAKTAFQSIGDIYETKNKKNTTSNGPGSKLPGKSEKITETNIYKDKSIGQAFAELSGQTLINIFGFEDTRRRIAKRLMIDPYTTNLILQKKLNDVAWQAFTGGLGVDLVLSMIPGGTLISSTSLISDWVYDLPPGDLQVKIQKHLERINISEEWIDLFLRHRNYSLTLRIALVEDLVKFEEIESVKFNEIMNLALTVKTEEQARFLINSIDMLSRYHENGHFLKEINIEGTVTGITKTGKLVIPAPVDYLSWTKELENFKNRDDAKLFSGRVVIIHGKVSDFSAESLKELGWEIEFQPDLLKVPFANK